jgi:hypothetical protein
MAAATEALNMSADATDRCRMKSILRVLPLAALLAALFLLPAGSAPAASSSTCPSTFQVLHNDHIGNMSLPAGAYVVTVSGGLGCSASSTLFAQFLEDYDGNLPYPWNANNAKLSFTRGNGPVGFSVKRTAFPPAPPSPPTPGNPVNCPTSFSVLHNDHIGSVPFPKGAYRTSLTSRRMTCLQASQLFAIFLDDPVGNLPSPWRIAPISGNTPTALFSNVPRGIGFQTTFISSNSGGGGHYPNDGTLCPSSFRVLHDDHIGSLYIPAGPYDLIDLSGSGLSCSQVSRSFANLLNYPSGRLPSPWVLDPATATFTRGYGSPTGFRIKPVNGTI